MPALDQITTFVLAKRDSKALTRAQELLHSATLRVLADGLAVEGQSDFVDSRAAATALADIGLTGDACVMAVAGRRKGLLICDMDSTLIGQECIDELADFAGVKDRVSAITERAMRGEIGFEGALTERVGLLEGLSLDVLQRCFDERITLNPGARTLCQTMKAQGAKTLIVSGGFTFFSQRVAEATGFAAHQANVLLDDGDALTGKVAMPILGREAKEAALRAATDSLGGPETAIALGDGANDLAMIQAAGLGIAFEAKPAVAAAAHSAINHTDLTSALFFQGYHEDEFVTD